MKGLIYRELYLGRKNYLLHSAVFVFMFVISVLVYLSMEYGNLARLPEEELADSKRIINFIFSAVIPAILFMLSFITTDVAGSDFKSRWMLFQYTTPVKEEKYILAKYIIMLGSGAAAFVLSLLNAEILSLLSGTQPEKTTYSAIVLIMSAVLSSASIVLTFTNWLRSYEKAMILYTFTVFAVYIAVVITAVFKNLTSDMLSDTLKELCIKAAPLSVFVMLAVMAVTYFLNVKLLKRRQIQK